MLKNIIICAVLVFFALSMNVALSGMVYPQEMMEVSVPYPDATITQTVQVPGRIVVNDGTEGVAPVTDGPLVLRLPRSAADNLGRHNGRDGTVHAPQRQGDVQQSALGRPFRDTGDDHVVGEDQGGCYPPRPQCPY